MNNVFSTKFSGNVPVILARKMIWEALDKSFWGKFAGYTTPNRIPARKGEFPTEVQNNPIVVHNELGSTSGDLLEIPMHRRFRAKPKVSGQQLIGFEETPKINHAKIPIDETRHATEPMRSRILYQIKKDYQLIEKARPGLQMHYADQSDFLGICYSFYYGFSWNIIQGKAFFSDTRFTVSSHPHCYVAGTGKISYGTVGWPGTATYEAAIGTAVAAMGATNVFDTKFLNYLRSDPQINRIRPIRTMQGRDFYVIVAHSWQINDLLADTTFNPVTSRALVGDYAKDNPFLVGVNYIWGAFAIFEHSNSCWPVNVASSDPGFTDGHPIYGPFGASYDFNSDAGNLDYFRNWDAYGGVDNGDFAGMILGDNAIYKGIAGTLEWAKESFDYGATLGVAYSVLDGYSRSDHINFDDGTQGQYLVNDGSAMFITKATRPNA